MKLKKIFLGAVAFVSALTLAACGSSTAATPDSIKEKGKLVVTLNAEFAPFEFQTLVDGKNTIVGSDVELAKAIGKELGVEVEFSNMSFENVLASLQSGKADIAVSGISATDERKEVCDFADSYYKAVNKVIIKKSDAAKYTSIDSLASLSVAAQKGSIQETVVKEQLPNSSLVSLSQNGEMITELKSDKVQAVVLEEPIAQGYVDQNDDLMLADIELDSSSTDSYAVAMPKGSDALKEVINKVIQEQVSSGAYEKAVEEASKLTAVE